MMDTKRPLVLWSGGLDSTVLVMKKLLEGDIDILYVNLRNNIIQQKYERKAIAKLKAIIKDDPKFKGRIIEEHRFKYGTLRVSKQVFAQPALWVHAAAFINNVNIHSSVCIAYVKHDDVWHYKQQVQEAYKAMNNLICDGEMAPLEFPLEWETKKYLKNWLDYNTDYCNRIMNLIYYCEDGVKGNCGECISCKRHINELGSK
jgi:7-cyano-7-deazaguanine synthase in queuosine biosynthesis